MITLQNEIYIAITTYKAKNRNVFWKQIVDNITDEDTFKLAGEILEVAGLAVQKGRPLGNALCHFGETLSRRYNLYTGLDSQSFEYKKRCVQLAAGAVGTLRTLGHIEKTTVQLEPKKKQNYIISNSIEMDEYVKSLPIADMDVREVEEWTGPVDSKGRTIITRLRKEDYHHYTYDKCPLEYDFLNLLGSVEWKVNKEMLKLAEQVLANDQHPLHLSNCTDEELTEAYQGISDNQRISALIRKSTEESVEDWGRREAVTKSVVKAMANKLSGKNATKYIMDKNLPHIEVIKQRANYSLFIDTLAEALERQDETIRWAYFKCSRGRNYPRVANLSPQGTDFSKSLIHYKNGKPWTEEAAYWVMVEIATCAGHDKISFDERVAWVEENTWDLLGILKDGADSELWKSFAGDEPWMLYRAILAYRDYLFRRDETLCHIGNAQDCTTSGLQITAMLTGDKKLAETTNILQHPTRLMGDAYIMVAENVSERLKKANHEFADIPPKELRPNTKRPTMTTVYSCKKDGIKLQTYQDRGNSKVERIQNMKWDQAAYLGSEIADAIFEVFPEIKVLLDTLQSAASIAADSGNITISWTTPTGFRAYQTYELVANDVVKTAFGKGQSMLIRVNYGTGKPDKKAHRRAIGPDVVHSLDASMLCLIALSMANIEDNFAFIHDSLSVSAENTAELREAFKDVIDLIFKPDLLSKLVTEITGVPTVCPYGDLQLSRETLGDYSIN